MNSNVVVILCALFYLGLLFGVAYYAEYRLKKGRSIIDNGYVSHCRWEYIAPPGLIMEVLAKHLPMASNF